jgi:hypothetical protein
MSGKGSQTLQSGRDDATQSAMLMECADDFYGHATHTFTKKKAAEQGLRLKWITTNPVWRQTGILSCGGAAPNFYSTQVFH